MPEEVREDLSDLCHALQGLLREVRQALRPGQLGVRRDLRLSVRELPGVVHRAPGRVHDQVHQLGQVHLSRGENPDEAVRNDWRGGIPELNRVVRRAIGSKRYRVGASGRRRRAPLPPTFEAELFAGNSSRAA